MFLDPKSKTSLDKEIDKLVLELETHEPTSTEFGTIVERLSKLHKIQEDRKPESINPNTVLTIGANLAGILMIINYEHLGVISTKAMSFIPKIK